MGPKESTVKPAVHREGRSRAVKKEKPVGIGHHLEEIDELSSPSVEGQAVVKSSVAQFASATESKLEVKIGEEQVPDKSSKKKSLTSSEDLRNIKQKAPVQEHIIESTPEVPTDENQADVVLGKAIFFEGERKGSVEFHTAKAEERKKSRKMSQKEVVTEDFTAIAKKLRKTETIKQPIEKVELETVNLVHHEFESEPQDENQEMNSIVRISEPLEDISEI